MLCSYLTYSKLNLDRYYNSKKANILTDMLEYVTIAAGENM